MYRPNFRRLHNSKVKIYAALAAALVVIIFLIVRSQPFTASDTQVKSSGKATISDALKTMPLNKEFKFPLKDDKGETVGEIRYIIESAELRDEIIIKGQKAYAVKGKLFMVLNLKIINESSKNISMSTKDYARLFVNNNESEPLSPSIHNDPVVVDAISVKSTRIGFTINENDKDLKIKVGEIKGDKTIVDIKF